MKWLGPACAIVAWICSATCMAAAPTTAPNYLPAVPRDPLAKKDGPLWYMLAENGKRPVVWSVGDNGIAETTDETVLPAEANYSWRATRRGENDDQWIDLAAWKP